MEIIMSKKYTNLEWLGKKIIVGETEFEPYGEVNLLIGFHGAESTPENMLVHGNRMELKNTMMVFPEGPVDAGKGLWSWWQDGPRQKEAVKQFVEYTAQIIDEANKHLNARLPEVKANTCLWGFSQGGAASLIYALLGSHSLHKVASVCGFLPEFEENSTAPGAAISILGIFGANDQIVPSFLADYALDEMKNRGHKIIARETPQGHELNQENLKELADFFKA
jgi:predicted esterase